MPEDRVSDIFGYNMLISGKYEISFKSELAEIPLLSKLSLRRECA